MSGPRETLGYPSRRDAVAAFRAKGWSTEAIAEKIGITAKNVLDVEYKRRKVERQVERAVSGNDGGMFPTHVRTLLAPKARERDISVDRLISDLVATIAEDNLVDAILDDGGAK